MRVYFWRCLKRAFSGGLGRADTFSGVVTAILSAFSQFNPWWSDTVNTLLWVVPLAVLGGTVTVGLVLSPYLVHLEDERKARHFDAKTIMLPKRPKYSRKRLEQVRQWLNENIEEGERLSREMQTRSFNWAQLELWVHRWVQSIARDVNEIMPEYSDYILAELGSITAEERLLYNGWETKEATLRVTVDRYLAKLRRIHSRL